MNIRSARWALLMLLLIGVPTTLVHAQYPPGYGGYGWHGWGGGSESGRTAAGMGAMAAGAGVGAANLGAGQAMNAQARSMNAQTAMGVNNYLWEINQRNTQAYYARLAQEQKDTTNAWSQIHDRVLNNPNEIDIADGDSLNALYAEITNPKVYPRTLELAQKPLRSSTVKNLPFNYAAGGLTYSILELTSRDTIPAIFDDPAFADQRKAIRAIADELKKEADVQENPKPATIKKFRAGLDGIKATLEQITKPETDERLNAEKYLKALYGLSKMIDSPSYDVYLAAVDRTPTVPLCEVLIFMHSFNLRFGKATTPELREVYSQLYGALSELRQAVNAPPQDFMNAATNGPKRDDRVTNYFAGMPYQYLTGPSGNQPQPPPPGAGPSRP